MMKNGMLWAKIPPETSNKAIVPIKASALMTLGKAEINTLPIDLRITFSR
jgi:hypothetical protein